MKGASSKWRHGGEFDATHCGRQVPLNELLLDELAQSDFIGTPQAVQGTPGAEMSTVPAAELPPSVEGASPTVLP